MTKRKEFLIIISILIALCIGGTIGIAYILKPSYNKINKYRQQRDSARQEMVLRHELDQETIDSISNQNEILNTRNMLYDSLLTEHEKLYDNLLKKKIKDYEEITNASDSNHIVWFLRTFPRH